MASLYRNFYTTSEDDMRELEVVKNYISDHNLVHKYTDMKYSPVIVAYVEVLTNKDAEFFRKYGFSET